MDIFKIPDLDPDPHKNLCGSETQPQLNVLILYKSLQRLFCPLKGISSKTMETNLAITSLHAFIQLDNHTIWSKFLTENSNIIGKMPIIRICRTVSRLAVQYMLYRYRYFRFVKEIKVRDATNLRKVVLGLDRSLQSCQLKIATFT